MEIIKTLLLVVLVLVLVASYTTLHAYITSFIPLRTNQPRILFGVL